MLELQHIELQFGQKILFTDLNFSLYPNQKIGFVGRNGAGKSSLFNLILNQLSPDKGEVVLSKQVRVAAIEQEMTELDKTALDYVIAGNANVGQLYLAIKQAEGSGDYDQLARLHQQMAERQGYAIEATASEILVGLGFEQAELNKPVREFSGGWRVRLKLARCLISPADLLLLDEPTNHLDLEAQYWLEKWLKGYAGSLLVISHDRDFLDNVTGYTLAIESQNVKLYQGSYSAYEKQYAAALASQQSLQLKQTKQREHLMSFVNRFRAKASKAKQAQSRLKQLEKLEDIAIAQVDSGFSFSFFESKLASNPLVSLEQVDFSYDSHSVFKKADFSISNNARIGLLGLNGAGKSTLIKLVSGELQADAGQITLHKSLRIGYFAQHQLESLTLDQSPLWHIQQLNDRARENELRSYLGGFGFRGEVATSPIKNFSGGEKARLALALIIWQKPNLLLLDEPTNHLDIQMREALTLALQTYTGALIVVAHDKHLLQATVDEFYWVNEYSVQTYCGNLDDYLEMTLNAKQKRSDQAIKPKSATTQAKPVSKQLVQLESKIEKLTVELTEVDKSLADPKLYQGDGQELTQLTLQREQVKNHLNELEEKWLALQE